MASSSSLPRFSLRDLCLHSNFPFGYFRISWLPSTICGEPTNTVSVCSICFCASTAPPPSVSMWYGAVECHCVPHTSWNLPKNGTTTRTHFSRIQFKSRDQLFVGPVQPTLCGGSFHFHPQSKHLKTHPIICYNLFFLPFLSESESSTRAEVNNVKEQSTRRATELHIDVERSACV